MRLHEIDEIMSWQTRKEILKSNFKITGKNNLLGKSKLLDNGMVSIDGDCISIRNARFVEIPLDFDEVTGDFRCQGAGLTSLKNSPRIVDGTFSVVLNNITSLEGGPDTVGEIFLATNNKLSTLKGLRTTAFSYGFSSNQLTDLNGGPSHVSGFFDCSQNKITSLIGGPNYVGAQFNCGDNPIRSLEGIPEYIGDRLELPYHPNLGLLRILFITGLKEVKFLRSNNSGVYIHEEISDILNRQLGKGRGGALVVAAELTKSGFKRNAKL